MKNKRILSAAVAVVSAFAVSASPLCYNCGFSANDSITADAADANITIDDMPADFKAAADWIWTNRIEREQSTVRRNTVFDQIDAGKGTINYVVKCQSYRQVTYEQRQKFEKMLSDCINAWNDWLAGYDGWKYDHIDVKVVGWAVIDKNSMLDVHDDEVIYTDTKYYDSQYDTSNGNEEIPNLEPFAPSELSRFDHFFDTSYQYPGGLDKRFDMYAWATQGFPYIGGCGGDWGQRLGDVAYLNMLDGENLHVLEHEIGHGFGMTDFYGGEGESDGYPVGGFPGGENSIMMAGSATKITNFDGWMLRYMWTKIKNEEGRFDLSDTQPDIDDDIHEYGNIKLDLPEIDAFQGDDLNIRLHASNPDNDEVPVYSAEFDIKYDIPMTYQWYDRGSYYNCDVEEHDTYVHVKFTADNEDITTIADDSGLFYLGLKVPDDCPVGTYPLYLDNVVFKDVNGNDLAGNVTLVDGKINVFGKETTTQTTATIPVETTTTTTTTGGEDVSREQKNISFTAEIEDIGAGTVRFKGIGTFSFTDVNNYYGGNENFNLSHYEKGDVVSIDFDFSTGYSGIYDRIEKINSLELVQNVRETTTTTTDDTTGTSTETTVSEENVSGLKGDANEDGKVSISDAVRILQYVANSGKYELSEQGKINADVDGKAGVTGSDAAEIQKYDAGLIKEFN